MLDQTAMDALKVRKVRWISKVTLPRTDSQRLLVVDRQTDLFPGSHVSSLETVQGLLFLSTNQNYYWTCLQNFKGRDSFHQTFYHFRQLRCIPVQTLIITVVISELINGSHREVGLPVVHQIEAVTMREKWEKLSVLLE